jgi:UDP-GlcNAc:undecaprenyl-phosphate GlcNAc-1-phosphate transferase|tara:strand:+ start:138 stop:1673 length:1536 start_codon:yes stop_codon:yes gene_type:complete
MDHPNERKIHNVPTPRIGGIAFAPVIIILGWFLFNTSETYTWYFLGAMGMFLLGAIDDYYAMSWRFKLPIQIFIGLLIVFQFFPYIETVLFFGKVLPLSKWFLMGIFLFWFIGITNSINLIDGLDGLAGGFMLLISFAAAILGFISGNPVFTFINVLFIAALLAFLHFNQKPAKFFMGDSGSLLLGYHLAVLPLLFSTKMSGIIPTIDMTPFILLATYLIVDTIRVVFIRIKHGRHPLEPDQLHLHYQIYNHGRSHNGTLMAIFILCGIGCLLSILPSSSFIKSGFMMSIYLIILGMCTFIPAITNNFINLVVNLNSHIRKRKVRSNSLITIFNVKLLTYLIGIYFISLIVLYNDQLSYLSSFPFVLILGTIFALFILQEAFSGYRSNTAMLISFGIFHIYIMSLGVSGLYPISDQSGFISLFSWLRYGSLFIASIVVIANYLLNSVVYGEHFWSVTDLLIIFLLVGMIGVQPLGIGFPPTFSFEIGLVYFANKLWLPLFSESLAKARLPA